MINAATLFSLTFWKNEAIAVATTFALAFAGTLAAYTAAPTVKDVEIAAWSSLAAALTYFVHSVGSTAATKQAAAKAAK